MKIYFILFFYTFTNLFFGQTVIKQDSVFAEKIKIFTTNYKEFELVGNEAYAITKGDSLVSFNLETKKKNILSKSAVSLVKNVNGEILFIDKKGNVFKQIKKNKFEVINSLKGNLFYKILVDNQNEVIVFSDKAIHYKNFEYIPNIDSPFYRRAGRLKRSDFLIPADFLFVDKNNYLWFTYDAGEWGGDICFLNLKNGKFIYDIYDNNGTEFPYNFSIGFGIKGITYSKDNLFVSSSRMHFSISGEISKINKENNVYQICHNKDILTRTSIDTLRKRYVNVSDVNLKNIQESCVEEYLGPIQFNPFNNSVYYYSNFGFFKLEEFDDCNFSKKLLFRPWIYWTDGLPDAVGYQMNVTKFEFISEKELVFLTTNNGIGYYNGTEVKYFQ